MGIDEESQEARRETDTAADAPAVTAAEPLVFKRGAIGMIDALGFKGIWGNAKAPSMDAWQTLRDARAAAATLSSRWPVLFQIADKGLPREVVERIVGASIDVRLLSDTLVIAA